ncbi:20534_t:CDS:2 [Cetraspora pellucida]|uniref:20534_t:CDS:1 n=1 Tax=Cetraspora pellucida TaxID=1433469 RepID=A0A9N9ITQ9_9GLOM|nr:20534_t:CDS:2 [Cetraspora pellucida]
MASILTLSLTIGGIIFAPTAVVYFVRAIGFGSSGILARSFAAQMMSYLYGGATATGSIVSILQSVGAAGHSFGSMIAWRLAVAFIINTWHVMTYLAFVYQLVTAYISGL